MTHTWIARLLGRLYKTTYRDMTKIMTLLYFGRIIMIMTLLRDSSVHKAKKIILACLEILFLLSLIIVCFHRQRQQKVKGILEWRGGHMDAVELKQEHRACVFLFLYLTTYYQYH